MSTKYKHSHEVPTSVLAKRLGELSDAVGKRGEDRDRELTRRVPAELDRDADLVLSEAAQRLVKLEAERDIMALDKQAGHYWRHVNAMTAEGLHSKSDIAAELAYRDARIAELEHERDAYRTAEEAQIALRQKIEQERDALAAHVERLVVAANDAVDQPRSCMMVAQWERAVKDVPASSLARVIAENRIEGALAVRQLTQGDDWEDTELRAVIDDYVAGLRRQTEGHQ